MWASFVNHSQDWAPAIIIAAISIVLITVASRLMQKRHANRPNSNLAVIGPLTTLTLIGIAVVTTILAMPIGDAAHGQLLGLLGLLVTGAIALSSTTILGNALAGIMLRAIRSFRPGDYVRVGEHVGRVSELGILHTEIQTEDRDLTTLPNLYLVTTPVTVLRESGTVISAQVSLGYDVSREIVEERLIEAAGRAGLVDPFVQVVDLGDFSIVYRAAGFLIDVKQVITTRSNLRKAILDSLHEVDVEIVSPTFMNQRRITGNDVFRPEVTRAKPSTVITTPEERIFDKADAAEAKAKMHEELEAQTKIVAELQEKVAAANFEAEKSQLDEELVAAKARIELLENLITQEEG